ncbi:MAG: hypothetical protein ACPLRW_05700 [Moorellales bacterium]
MGFQELLALLEDDPTEANLAEAGVTYFIVHGVTDDLDHLGTIFAETEDGLAALPYKDVLADQGYEQIDLGAARLVSAAEVDFFRGELAARIRALSELEDVLGRLARKEVV